MRMPGISDFFFSKNIVYRLQIAKMFSKFAKANIGKSRKLYGVWNGVFIAI